MQAKLLICYAIAPCRVHRLALVSLAALCLAILAGPIHAQPCTLPPESELTGVEPPRAPHWTDQEKWVWARTLAGEIADFNQLYCVNPPLDPHRADGWSGNVRPRRLSARFLLDVTTVPEFADAVPRRGVRIFGAWFGQDIDLAAIRFDRELWLNDSRFDGEFHMRYARAGLLSVEGSRFAEKFDLENAHFRLHVLLSDRAAFHGLAHLFGIRVDGNLLADGSTFHRDLNLASADIGINLLLRNQATFHGAVNLSGARVGGVLDVGNAVFEQGLYMSGASVTRDLYIEGSRFNDNLLMSSAQVAGALHLGNSASWPADGDLYVDGFVYGRVSSGMMSWPTSDYEDWLARDDTASPQPYRHLATVFEEAGAYEKANDIRYASRERARAEASGLRWLWLTLLKVTIGYGIGSGYFRALIPAAMLTLVGTVILRTSNARAEGRSWSWCFWASFDEMLPLVRLDEAHAHFINAHLSGWRLSYFYAHRIVAFVLGSFVVAGLAGLTQGP